MYVFRAAWSWRGQEMASISWDIDGKLHDGHNQKRVGKRTAVDARNVIINNRLRRPPGGKTSTTICRILSLITDSYRCANMS